MNWKVWKKAIVYRVYATSIAQVGVFILFQRFDLNGAVLLGDIIQFFGYYTFERLWNEK